MIDKSAINALEFPKVLEMIQRFAVSSFGKRLVEQLLPAENYNDCTIMLKETAQAIKLLYTYIISPEFGIDDISDALAKADKAVTLSMGEILKVCRMLRVARINKEMIEKVNANDIELIKDYANLLYPDQSLEEEINKCILSEYEMSDNASYELKSIRQAILRLNDNIKQKLHSYISSSSYNKYLQDSIVTIRNNRYCLPVKSECRGQIQGLIHDQSSSLATVFVEPFAIVEMNNEIANLRISEQIEIERILKAFTVKISGCIDELLHNFEVIGSLDCIFARAIFCYKNKATMPILTTDQTINIKSGRHPLIDKDKVVPINVTMDKHSRIMVISGSNTGGKTVTMKLVGLSTLMAMSGIFPFCQEESVFKYFDNVFCDIGDHQSIEMSLSTFSSHMSNIIYITNNISQNNLVMLDELGAGTDPVEGSSLAVAVTKTLIESNCFALITTHFSEMKNMSNQYDCVVCASMDFDPISYAPKYRLIMNSTGSSNALRIAGILGLKQEILDLARDNMPKDRLALEVLMESAEQAKRFAEDYKDQMATLKAEIEVLNLQAKKERDQLIKDRQKLNEKMKREANILVKEYLEEADELIDELKAAVARGSEKDLFHARNIKSKLATIEYDEEEEKPRKYLDTPISLHDSVFITTLNAEGEVIAIDERKREYTVRVGRVQSKVKMDKVKKVVASAKKVDSIPQVTIAKKVFSNVAVPLELNIIGKNTMDGIHLLDAYIDSVIGAGYKEVRIVHGKGSGILRKAVHEYLKESSRVLEYRLGNWGEGDTGVTIVKIK